MIRIAICDDDKEQLKNLRRMLKLYLSAHPDVQACYCSFLSGEQLLEQVINRGAIFDLFILDVIMPELSGLKLGLKLREWGCDGMIVYLTISSDFAVDSYLVSAFYYLLKPIDLKKFYEVLNRAFKLMSKRRNASVVVRTKTNVKRVCLDDICYAELVNRGVRYHMSNGEILDSVKLHVPFKEAISFLDDDKRFVLCGSSYVINLQAVISVNKAELTLDNGQNIPLPRSRYSEIKKSWIDFWLGSEKCLS